MLLLQEIYKSFLLQENNSEYLQKLNLQQLQKTVKPELNQDKKDYYKKLQNLASQGPLFSKDTIEHIAKLEKDNNLVLTKDQAKWLANNIQKKDAGLRTINSANDLRNIFDYINHEHIALTNQSFEDIKDASDEWHQQFKKSDEEITGAYKSKDVIYSFPDGYTIVHVPSEDLEHEGEMMGHCVGSYCEKVDSGNSTIFSLRDSQNRPHVTIEIDPSDNKVIQVQGKEDKEPVKKYWKYLEEFFVKNNLIDSETIKYMTNPELLEKLANDENLSIRSLTAQNPNTPVYVLEKLANDESWSTRTAVAENPSTPAHVLEKLANDENPSVRYSVAHNSNTSVHILEKLANDKNADVRSSVAYNSNISVQTLEKLANNEEWNVRSSAAHNSNISVQTLEKLANDKNWSVRYYVAQNPNTLVQTLEKLANDISWNVRSSAARNPNTPIQTFEKLANDRYIDVRNSVARNPNTPVQTLEKLANDEYDTVRSNAIKNLEDRNNRK